MKTGFTVNKSVFSKNKVCYLNSFRTDVFSHEPPTSDKKSDIKHWGEGVQVVYEEVAALTEITAGIQPSPQPAPPTCQVWDMTSSRGAQEMSCHRKAKKRDHSLISTHTHTHGDEPDFNAGLTHDVNNALSCSKVFFTKHLGNEPALNTRLSHELNSAPSCFNVCTENSQSRHKRAHCSKGLQSSEGGQVTLPFHIHLPWIGVGSSFTQTAVRAASLMKQEPQVRPRSGAWLEQCSLNRWLRNVTLQFAR